MRERKRVLFVHDRDMSGCIPKMTDLMMRQTPEYLQAHVLDYAFAREFIDRTTLEGVYLASPLVNLFEREEMAPPGEMYRGLDFLRDLDDADSYACAHDLVVRAREQGMAVLFGEADLLFEEIVRVYGARVVGPGTHYSEHYLAFLEAIEDAKFLTS